MKEKGSLLIIAGMMTFFGLMPVCGWVMRESEGFVEYASAYLATGLVTVLGLFLVTSGLRFNATLQDADLEGDEEESLEASEK